ncbi:MAG TPA: hypothetical protein VLU43_15840 [Anaeromyxobacteraceae bacterium]|nr:hypothetical protein [Anaeromyxobacteraceae bacterium]
MNVHRNFRSATRAGATSLALVFLQMTTGCAHAKRVALDEPQRNQIGSARTVASLSGQELGVSVVMSTGGAGFGLIGALVDSAVTNSRAKAAEAVAAPIRDALVDYDAGAALGGALKKELAPLAWLKKNTVDVRRVADTKEAVAELVKQSGTDVVVLVQTDHRLTPAFDAIVITAKVSVLPRAPTQAAGDEGSGPAPLYLNTISTAATLPGFVEARTTLEQASQLWADGRGRTARRALDGGMAELASMIAFDLAEHGPAGASLYEAPPDARQATVIGAYGNGTATGFVVREANGRAWVRLPTGELSAIGGLVP